MAQVKNNTLGTRYIGDIRILAGKSEYVPDAEMKSAVVRAWVESGDVEVVKVKPAGKSEDVPDDEMKSAVVQDLVESGDVEIVKAK